MKRKCSVCGKVKNLKEFPVRGKRANGTPSYRGCCKHCWRHRHRESNKAYEERKKQKHEQSNINTDVYQQYILMLAECSDYSIDRLDLMTKEDFTTACSLEDFDLSFTTLKEKTFAYLDELGIGNPSFVEIEEDGNVLVMGDTFGQHTRSAMFNLINNIVDTYKVHTIVVVGRQLDEHDTLSNRFADIKAKLVFVATADEITKLHKINKDLKATIVRDYVKVGGVTVRNQEQITPYMKKGIGTLDPFIFKGDVVVNCTRQEFANRFSDNKVSFIASPGTLAEKHVRKVINKILLKGGESISTCLTKSFHKYRRNQEDLAYWSQGVVVLNKKGSSVIPVMLPIKQVNGLYVTAYDGVVTTSESNGSGTKQEFDIKQTIIISDLHIPQHNVNALRSLLSYMSQRWFDNIVFAGDICDGNAVNHHIISKNRIPEYTMRDELLATASVLDAFDSYNNDDDTRVIFMKGNHEDFVRKYGLQADTVGIATVLTEVWDSLFSQYSTQTIEPTDSFVLDGVTITHGHTGIAVQGSTNTEKAARAFGDSVVGHSHSSEIRFGSVRSGCLCNKMDYTGITKWDTSVVTITTVADVPFISLIRMDDRHDYRLTDLYDSCYSTDRIIINSHSYVTCTIGE